MTPPSHKGKKIIKINAICQAQLIKLMLDGVYTCHELAEQTGLHYVTVLQYARELHAAGAAYICAWEKDSRGRDAIKVYKIGEHRDAQRKRLTAAQRQAKSRTKRFNLDMMQRMAA
jgi:predicted ArsR family transcriptional regulator